MAQETNQNQEEKFDFSKFLQDSKNVLLAPKEYFKSFNVKGGYVAPIIKALIYGAVAGLFKLIWSVTGLTLLGGGILGGAVGIGAFFFSIIGAVIGLFIGAIIILVVSSICNGNNDFEANTRVSASLMVIIPISAFLGFFQAISPTLHSIIILAVNVYGVWMLYNAVVNSLNGKVETAKVVSYILAAILLIFMIIGLATRNVGNRMAKKYGFDSKNMREYQKAAEKMAKDYEKAAEEMTKEMAKESEKAAEAMKEAMAFKIQMANGDVIKDVDKGDIKDALDEVDEDNSTIILSKSGRFIQAAVTEDGFLMEYRDASGYFSTKKTDLSKDDVEDALIDFFKEDDDYKEDFEWEEK